VKHFGTYLVIALCQFISSFAIASQEHYKLYFMYTPDYQNLVEEIFLPSIKDDFELIMHQYPQDCPSSQFRAEGWDQTMLNKLTMLQTAVLDNWNQVFFYSDVDIIFLRPILDRSLDLLGSNDFVVQQGWPANRLCAGFFVMRGNEKTLRLINNAYSLLKEHICIDDQVALQRALDNTALGEIAWEFLPAEQYPTGRGVLKKERGHYTEDSAIELTDSMILFHASCCIGIENKMHFLRRVQNEFMNRRGPD